MRSQLEAVVVSVEYAKSPRYPFPHALLQIYQVLQWCLSPEAADVLGVAIDANRVAIMGNSAGGNLTAALSLLTSFTSGPCKAFRAGLPSNYRQVAQILLYPSTALNQQYSARLAQSSKEVQAKSLPAWAAELMEASYLPPMIEKEQMFVAPIVADPALLNDVHKNIAPVFCYLAGMDCLKDEGARYCQKLRDAEVEVETRVYPEAIHGFSHYKPGNKDYRDDDVKDCWGNIVEVLSRSFQRPAHPQPISRD
jgi:acetyl esterase